MGIRENIDNLIRDIPKNIGFDSFIGRVVTRADREIEELTRLRNEQGDIFLIIGLPVAFMSIIIGIISPNSLSLLSVVRATLETRTFNFDMLLDRVEDLYPSGAFASGIELIGSAVTTPLLDFFYDTATELDDDPLIAVRRFYGILSAHSLLGAGISSLGEVGTGGLIKNLAKPIESLYWNFGLGFISWQLLTPFVEASILNKMTEKTNREFRPTRFQEGDLFELYRRKKVTAEYFWDNLRALGWRDIDIHLLHSLKQKDLSEGRILQFFDLGYFQEIETKERLVQQGYSETNADLIIRAVKEERIEDTKSISLGLSRNALKAGEITEQEFRDLLKSANYSDKAIDLEIRLIRLNQQIESRSLSLSQIKQAHKINRLSDADVRNELKRNGYPDNEINVILDTWIEQKKPRVLRINQSTILKAMRSGVISTDEARTKLINNGFSASDAEIILQAEVLSGGTVNKLPSLAILSEGLQIGIIPKTEFIDKLKSRGFTQVDAELIATITLERNKIKLDEATLIDAFLYDQISEQRTIELLRQINIDDTRIEIVIDTTKERKKRNRVAVKPKQIALWYFHGFRDRDESILRLVEQGMSSDDAALFLDTIDLGTPKPPSSNDVLKQFEFGVIDENTAIRVLMTTGISEENAIRSLEAKKREIQNTFIKPTPTLLVKSFRDGLLTSDELNIKLLALGIPENDLPLYLNLANQITESVELKLSKTDILNGFKQGELTYIETIGLLEQIGYTLEEGDYLIRITNKGNIGNEIARILQAGIIDAQQAFDSLLALGLDENEVEEWIIKNQ